MKNLILIISLLSVIGLNAQNAPIDFESGGYGAEWTWTVFENDDNPPVEIIENPDMTGVNTSSTVAKITARQTGAPWVGCESMHGSDIGSYSINASNATIKIMVWKSVISDVGIKLVKPDGWSMGEIKVANTVVNEWEELTFDFSSQVQDGYDQIVIFPDFDLAGRTQDNIIYFDNITFSEQGGGGTGAEPETAAVEPTQDSQNVISMFSDVYDDVTVDTWRTDWSEAALEDVMIEGNPTKKYTALNYVGIETVGANLIDATAMTHFHLDVWTPDANDFKVKLVDFGADAAYGGGDDTEHEITFAAPEIETWISYDIALSDFTDLLNRDHIAQLILVKAPQGTIFVDNVFYYQDIVGLDDYSSLSNYKLYDNQPNPFSHATTIKFEIPSQEQTEISILDISGRRISTIVNTVFEAGTHQVEWNITNEKAGIYFIKIEAGSFVDVKKCIIQ
ncbi:T9SS type A sorting domain-containing protein [Lentimicrobium sp. S6]|uniref:T9SS type A sorting domain-containing protein n=1 Tax=Lentimicrobium sp. S6 TaxID=2735872 RepID=UPI0015559517|nr:T9SS type A sorting domain-containing protein [Lentimicrobium sp. S6]NPD46287.1 T9SS type A sorting domain-containing protein [Lentimicrobium sp. S6]